MKWISILFLLFLYSCNNPLSKTYTIKTYESDIQQIRQSNKVSYEDIELLTKYIVVSQLAGNDMQGESYEDILDKIKDIRKFNNAQNDQQQMEKEMKRERMSSVANIGLLEKKISSENNREWITYTITIHNISQKNINVIVGSISINDLLERQIKKIDILIDEELVKNQKLQKKIRVPYNPADENDQRIRSKNLTEVRIEWNPERIIFTDGEVVQ